MNNIDQTAHNAQEGAVVLPTPKKYEVEINGKIFTRKSEPTPLLKEMEGTKYLYLPINTLYALLENLYDDFDIAVMEPVALEEKYDTEKTYWKNNAKQTRTETNKTFRKHVIVAVQWTDETGQPVGKQVASYVDGVAATSILSNDTARYAFFQKLEARGIKAALRKLAPVFRIPGDDEIDDITTEKVEEVIVRGEGNKASEVTAPTEARKRGSSTRTKKTDAIDAAVASTTSGLPTDEAEAKDKLSEEFSAWGLKMAQEHNGYTQLQLRNFTAEVIAKYGVKIDDGTKNMDIIKGLYNDMIDGAQGNAPVQPATAQVNVEAAAEAAKQATPNDNLPDA